MAYHTVKKKNTYSEALEEILSIVIDIELSTLGLGEVESRDLRNVLILALSLLFLQLEGNTADWSPLDTLHQMCGVTSDLYNKKFPVSPVARSWVSSTQ